MQGFVGACGGAEFADRVRLPWVASPARRVSEVKIDGRNLVIGPGAGDNAGAALDLVSSREKWLYPSGRRAWCRWCRLLLRMILKDM